MIPLMVLRKSEIFEGLTDDELTAIARTAWEETYEAGTRIFTENEAAKNLYVVRDGRVAILINIGRNKQTIIDTVAEGGSFGWSAIIPPYILTGTAKAVEKSRLIVISGQELRALCRQNCNTCYAIMGRLVAIMSGRLRDSRLQLISLMYD